jgi:microsomal dipeptidase-like Zn-dependent dipeptidase
VVVHLVSFKYRKDVDEAAREDHRTRLKALADVDGILDFKVGADFVRSPRSYDTGIVVLFRDRAALDGYATHPRHVPVAQLGRDLSESIIAVDFDA